MCYFSCYTIADMNQTIPAFIKDTYSIIKSGGYEVYLVGGSVRDLLLQKPIKDWDFTTSAAPEQILQLFPQGFYDNKFGTVGIPVETAPDGQRSILEITTFRTEDGYSDSRHPENVNWGKSLADDVQRRDFTINALAMELDSNQILDYVNGQDDLHRRIIKTVGDAKQRFKEDALRLMRAIRFATQLGFQIEEKTLLAIKNDAKLLQNISKERIRDELLKILSSEYPYEGVLLLKNTGLLEYILPELLEGISVSMVRPGRHHTTEVFEHNLLALRYCPSTDPIIRLAALIHDIAKPRVRSEDKNGLVIFHNHELVGAKMAAMIADRLRLSKKQKEKIVTLVRWHMFTVDEHITDAAVRRFIRRVGVENVKDILDVRIADRLGSGTKTAESWRLIEFKKRIEEQLSPAPFSINDLAIDGNDIMQELNLKPSKEVGEILQKLFTEVDEDLSKNSREYLLNRIKDKRSA